MKKYKTEDGVIKKEREKETLEYKPRQRNKK